MSRDAAFSFAYNSVVRLGTAALSVVIARLLGPTGAGELGLALQVTTFGVLASTINLPQGLAQKLSSTTDALERARLLRASARLVLGFGAMGGLAVALLATPLAHGVFTEPGVTPVLVACGPLVLATAGYLFGEGALQGLRRFPTLARWGAMVTVLDFALVLPAARFGVVGVLLARAVVRGGALLAAWVMWLRSVARGPATAEAEATATTGNPTGALLAFSGPTFLGASATLAGLLGLRTLLVRDAGLAAAGQLQAADSLAQGLLLIPVAAMAALMPAVSRSVAGGPGFEGVFVRGLTQVTGLHLGACLAAMALVPELVPLLFGREFEAARPAFVMLAAAYGLAGPCTVFGAALLGRGEVWTGAWMNVGWALVVLSVFAFLTTQLGASGAALAMAVAYFGLLAACVALLPARWSVPLSRVIAPVTGAAALTAAGAWISLQPGVPRPVAAGACLAMAAAALLFWARRAPTDAPERSGV